MKSEIILLRCEKKNLVIKIGIVWNRYKNLGDTLIFIRIILPANEIGSVDHLSRVILVRSQKIAKLSLKRSEIF